jgi:small subunit ribosomal protein S20
MAHSKHRKKTLRKSREQRLVNRGVRSTMRTAVRKARTAATETPADADPAIAAAASQLDRAANSRVIHPNKANRLKSRLQKAKNRAAAEG